MSNLLLSQSATGLLAVGILLQYDGSMPGGNSGTHIIGAVYRYLS